MTSLGSWVKARPRYAESRTYVAPVPVGMAKPLVHVDRPRVGALHAGKPTRHGGVEDAKQPVGTVDVEPDLVLRSGVGDLVELVNGSGVGRPGDAHDGDRHDVVRHVLDERVAKRVDGKPLPAVGR